MVATQQENGTIEAMGSISELIDQLDALDSDERQLIYDRLAYQEVTAAKRADLSDDERDIWESLCRVAGERCAVDSVFNDKKRARSAFRKNAELACSYLREGCREPLSRDQFRALVATGAQCLVDVVKKTRPAVTIQHMVEALPDWPIAMDQEFPGYAQAGMLGQLVRFAETKLVRY